MSITGYHSNPDSLLCAEERADWQFTTFLSPEHHEIKTNVGVEQELFTAMNSAYNFTIKRLCLRGRSTPLEAEEHSSRSQCCDNMAICSAAVAIGVPDVHCQVNYSLARSIAAGAIFWNLYQSL
jgi:hypothetical protein